jgi:cephalosporin hydroxylase
LQNFCTGCEPGSEHETHHVALLNGFPELNDDIRSLSAKSAELFKELRTMFPVDDNLYFYTMNMLGPALVMDRAGEDIENIPENMFAWIREYGESFLRRFVSLKSMGRFVNYLDRRAFFGRSANEYIRRTSQGTVQPIIWRGIPLLRTVWDFSLAPVMIQQVRPKTIIEIGTASGGSAVYYSDIQRLHDIKPNIVAVDISLPGVNADGVRFIQGDSRSISRALSDELLSELPHPWIVYEDSHVNIDGIFQYLHNYLQVGDYFCIEDVDAETQLFPFFQDHGDIYKVDTLFTDFFGYNNTCCPDQIFRRVT